ncbi:GYF domain-containing protein [Novipirellula maiorica]|nr:GYF domain-containing protein [Rhodopirellula maiorica]
MSAQWYYQLMGEELGPFTSKQLKEKAAAGEVAPDSLIRKGPDGDWITAIRVKRLFDAPKQSSTSPPPVSQQPNSPVIHGGEGSTSVPDAPAEAQRSSKRANKIRLAAVVCMIALGLTLVAGFGLSIAGSASPDAKKLLGDMTLGEWVEMSGDSQQTFASNYLEKLQANGLLSDEWTTKIGSPNGKQRAEFRLQNYFMIYPVMVFTDPDIASNDAGEIPLADVMIPALQAEGVLKSTSNIPKAKNEIESVGVPPIEFDGVTWEFFTDAPQRSSVWRRSMETREYRCGDRPGMRLLEQYLSVNSTETNFQRRLQMEVLVNDHWRRHGRCEEWMQNDAYGKREVSEFKNGKHHGATTIWYANGQKRIDESFVDGVRQGRSRGWYRNGSPWYDVTYLNGKEMPGGRSWRKDGTPN